MCPVVGGAASRAADASVAAGPDNAPRDPVPDVTPSGTPHCKNVCCNDRAPPQTTHNNPAEHNAAARNLRHQQLGAGLRATPTRQLLPPPRLKFPTPHLPVLRPPLLVRMLCLLVTPLSEVTALVLALLPLLGSTAAHAAVRDAAAFVPDASPARRRWPDTCGSTAGSANAWPTVDRPYCNNVLADMSARTTVHTPSEDNAAAGNPWDVHAAAAAVGQPLAVCRQVQENDSGPRESHLLPLIKSRSEASTSLRGALFNRFAPPFNPS
jgi:hypothetical protein